MNCWKCGAENRDDALRCVVCSASIGRSAEGQPGVRREVDSGLVQAILATIFCCQPFGIVAIVYAAMSQAKVSEGDYEGAARMSEKSRYWVQLSFFLGLAWAAVVLVIALVSGIG